MPGSSFDNCVSESKSATGVTACTQKQRQTKVTARPVSPATKRRRDKIGMDKIELLKEILTQSPGDAFARYGLAMEYASQGQVESSLAEFDQLLTSHPDYTAGYFMAAQTLAKAQRTEEARARLKEGILSAQRTGNQHALNEMQDLLEELD
jgi:predicted Zn-dependent protease